MSIPRMAKSMENIDDDLISGAADYKRTNKKHLWTMWATIAACLCIVVAAAIAIPKMNVPEQTSNSALCSTTTFYNDTIYIGFVTPEALKEVGLPETITEDMIGEHVAYLILSGEIADYIETENETDIELYSCLINTSREVYILRDGNALWPIAEMEKSK